MALSSCCLLVVFLVCSIPRIFPLFFLLLVLVLLLDVFVFFLFELLLPLGYELAFEFYLLLLFVSDRRLIVLPLEFKNLMCWRRSFPIALSFALTNSETYSFMFALLNAGLLLISCFVASVVSVVAFLESDLHLLC